MGHIYAMVLGIGEKENSKEEKNVEERRRGIVSARRRKGKVSERERAKGVRLPS